MTLKPRLSRRQPIEEAATPFPSEETTPPVTKIYFGAIRVAWVLTPGLSALHRIDVHTIMFATRDSVKSNDLLARNDISPALAQRNFSRWNGFEKSGEYSVKFGGSLGIAALEISRCATKPLPEYSPS